MGESEDEANECFIRQPRGTRIIIDLCHKCCCVEDIREARWAHFRDLMRLITITRRCRRRRALVTAAIINTATSFDDARLIRTEPL